MANRPWNLESFLDALIVELDRARDTLAVKGVTRPMTYSVQDVGLELQIFPQYDGRQVRFVTAEPGQEGASGLRIQLGSITSRGIRETTSEPISRDDIAIEELDDVSDDVKDSLRRIGVKSARDLERMEERDVDITKVGKSQVDYGRLANVINRARRRQVAPTLARIGTASSVDGPVLAVEGANLVFSRRRPGFPAATLDGRPVEVLRADDRNLHLRVDPRQLAGRSSRLELALDPYAVVGVDIEG